MTVNLGIRAQRAEKLARTAEMTRHGYSAPQIADELGVTPRTVVRWRHEAGVSGPPSIAYPAGVWVEVEQMLDDGASFAEIQRTLGVHRATLSRHYPGQSWSQEQCVRWAIEMRNIKKGMS